jgi:hypothetical protein
MTENYGTQITIDDIWDFTFPHDYKHFDASWYGDTASCSYEMYFHYPNQVRKRKLVVMVLYALPEKAATFTPETQEKIVSSPDAFTDIQQAIRNNTAIFYTKGIKTPTAFYPYFMTIPPFERTHEPRNTMRLPQTVTLIDSERIVLRCEICKQTWSPNIQTGGKLARGSKYCPNGCTQHGSTGKELIRSN